MVILDAGAEDGMVAVPLGLMVEAMRGDSGSRLDGDNGVAVQ
jgi:hypothetical protein